MTQPGPRQAEQDRAGVRVAVDAMGGDHGPSEVVPGAIDHARAHPEDRLILVGVLAAGATFATGWSDWADAEQRDSAVRRTGLVHAAANATATALMIGSVLARKRGARGRGKLLSLAGSAALGTGGWLGGHLSYTLGAGVTASPPAAGTQATATTSSA